MRWKIALSKLILNGLWVSSRTLIEATVTPGMGGVIFFGDSITHWGRWELLFPTISTRNFGISGERTDQLLARLEPIFTCRPEKLFILIGTNDLGLGISIEQTAANVDLMISRLCEQLPPESIFLQAVMPRARKFSTRIKALNARYREIALQHAIAYVDLFAHFDDGTGQLISRYTEDHLHLNGAGYLAWRERIGPLVLGTSSVTGENG